MATVVEPVKKTGKKAKSAAVDQAIEQLAENVPGERRKIPLSALRRHPDNRRPTEAAIGDVAASMDRVGQIEAAIVRPLFGNTYEVISGETRWLAAERLGLATLDCEVRKLTDSEALQVLAAANASRQDLTPIDKANLIVRLCQAKSEGGGGMTREEAAAVFDLQSGGAASNLVRLLELPSPWQFRVASGELPQTFARELLRLVPLDAGVWVELEEEWGDRHETNSEQIKQWSPFAARVELEQWIDNLVDQWTRVVERGDKQHVDAWHVEGAEWNQPCRFKMTPELEAELKIVDVTIDGETKRRATNVTLYDAFQIPAIKAHVAKQRAKHGGDGDSDRDEKPVEKLTPAQQAAEEKRRRAEAAEKLERRIAAWRTAWLRELCAAEIVAPKHDCLAIRICMCLQSTYGMLSFRNREDLELDEFLKSLWQEKRADAWECMLASNASRKTSHGAAELVAHWLRVSDRDGHLHPLSTNRVVTLARELKIDLDDAWLVGQSGKGRDDFLRGFCELHNGEQLDELGRELGVHVAGAKTKAIKVQMLSNCARILKLPKSLRLKELTGKAGV